MAPRQDCGDEDNAEDEQADLILSSGDADVIRNVPESTVELLGETNGIEPDSAAGETPVKQKFSVRTISSEQKVILALVFTMSCLWSIVFSCIGPFYPIEAQRKGASPTEVGLVFGIYEVVAFIMNPMFGYFLPVIGTRRLFLSGLLVSAVGHIAFGFLQWAPAGRNYIYLSLGLRSIESVGASAIFSAELPILAVTFPDSITTVTAIRGTCISLGFMLGPPLGGFLYTIGGFHLPFAVFGALSILVLITAYYILPKEFPYDKPSSEGNAYFDLLRIPVIPLALMSQLVSFAGFGFFDSNLARHLRSRYGMTTMGISLMFLAAAASEALPGPLVGLALDRRPWHVQTLLVGAVIAGSSYLLMGPSPLLAIEGKLPISIVANMLSGMGVLLCFIPVAPLCIISAKQAGLPSSARIQGAIAGLTGFMGPFGGFFGPVVGSIAVEHYGFPWAATGLSALFFAHATILMAYLILKRSRPVQTTTSPAPSA